MRSTALPLSVGLPTGRPGASSARSGSAPRQLPPPCRSAAAPIQNALTVDVEDWIQSVFDPDLPLTDNFRANTHAVLAALAAHNVRATFFVLGLAAEKAPRLVREIQAGGHEVQSHGYGHRLVHTLTPAQFRADLARSKQLLEDITGFPVIGYRAPAFSITRRNLWALDVLAEVGFRFDSSIFPLRTRRYGIDGGPRQPCRLRTPAGYELTEVPVACYQLGGRRVPLGGGGYFRLFPYALIRRCVRQLNAENQPATIYMHPYEYNPGEIRRLPCSVPLKLRWHQSLGRRGVPRKIDRLLREFAFGRVADLLAAAGL